jgi:hypothetical protein
MKQDSYLISSVERRVTDAEVSGSVGFPGARSRPKRQWTRRRAGSRALLVAALVLCCGAVLAEDDPGIELPGPLSASHADFEDPDSCSNCHNEDFEVEGDRCLVCHDAIADRIAARRGVHREVTTADCAVCHSEHGGRDAELVFLDPDDFDHAEETGFALEGFHGEFAGDCTRCHDTDSYLTLDTGCASCHGDAHRGTLGSDCTACHAVDRNFRNASRGFHKQGLFPLEGRHLEVPCADCHWDGAVKGTPTRCYDCHWIRRQDDPFRTRLGNECENCHRPISWTAVAWDHGAATGYPLGGQHMFLDCTNCHPGLRVDRPPQPDCVGCHLSDYQSTQDPDHEAAGFPTDCFICHRPSDGSWDRGVFVHPFQLVGRHALSECADCHAGEVYAGTPTDCIGCHLGDYNRADDPDHAAAGFPTDCELCHRPTDGSWDDGRFNHSYRLAGVHATLQCESCHSSGVYEGLPSRCVDCHLDEYHAATDPNHEAAGFPTNCNQCHRGADPDWHQGRYPHSLWPLVGSHTAQRCTACHTGTVYAGLPSECVDCHLDDYNTTDDPDHAAAGFPTSCELCHQPTSWEGADFAHSYPLQGVHATLDCSQCHSSGVYAGLPSDCVDCHLADYDDSDDPAHAAAGFSTDCDSCHRASDPDWTAANYPHSVYPLVGSHVGRACSACHSSGVYSGLPSECVDCHLDDYNTTDDPDHAAAGFPMTCELCHQPTSWEGADFDHTGYPLQGIHATLDCSQCHSSGVYAGLPSECVDCHLTDYQGTDDPDHGAAGFPTSCELCHQPTSWEDADIDHSGYPLQGIHATLDCSQCHSSGVYAGLPSECVDCHLADYQGTNDPDHDAAGFSTSCELCHQPTSWEDADIDHSGYPLQGIHATLDCSQCHSSGVYAGLPSECADCHIEDYNAARNPNHFAAGFPTDCELCHRASDTSFDQGLFDHFYFPITSGRHAGADCSECHYDPSSYAVFSCIDAGCHPIGDIGPEHSSVDGFVYNDTSCYGCHPDGIADDRIGGVSSHAR